MPMETEKNEALPAQSILMQQISERRARVAVWRNPMRLPSGVTPHLVKKVNRIRCLFEKRLWEILFQKRYPILPSHRRKNFGRFYKLSQAELIYHISQ